VEDSDQKEKELTSFKLRSENASGIVWTKPTTFGTKAERGIHHADSGGYSDQSSFLKYGRFRFSLAYCYLLIIMARKME
jgi:hypothetical protein